MDKIQLSKNIEDSNLPESDKKILISLLAKNDLTGFVNYFLIACKVGKEILRLFDIDIDD